MWDCFFEANPLVMRFGYLNEGLPLRFKGKALEHGNQQLWRKILIFQEGRIMVCPTNMGNIKCSSVRQFYSFFTNML
jgi:hypothetical protein